MDANEHEGILAIFLSEAEEIVRGLFVQLEELQYGYDGQRILDDIHRGFHTLYGGASVLKLEELSECARLAERVLERLRTRRLSLSPSLVSLIVGATSALEVMLSRMMNHQSVRAIPEDLRLRLTRAMGQETGSLGKSLPAQAVAKTPDSDEMTDREFENLLDSLYGKGQPPGRQPIASDSQTLTAVRPAAVTAPSPTIIELVSELSWVRNRLMGLRGEQHDEKLNKALAYLDLVTQDMERWVANRPDGKTP